MPPAQDDRNARQIEALRRYVAELGTNREREEEETGHEESPTERRGQPSPRWLLLTVALVAAALIGGVVIGGALENGGGAATGAPSAPGGTPVATAPLTAPVASPECKTAVDRANRSLTSAVKVRNVLGEYTRIMDDLRGGRIDGRRAGEQATPHLVIGSVESAKFDSALAEYRKIVDKCTLREP
jgi:hypothetical protein